MFHFGVNTASMWKVLMGKNNRNGQAEILSDQELDKIAKHLISKSHKLLFAIARYTGERFGAICKLRTSDVYDNRCKPLEYITFPASIRKAAPDGSRQTRQAFVFDRLKDALLSNAPDECDRLYLFPSSMRADKPITYKAADNFLRRAVERAGYSHRGIATHSFRRSFITKLHDSGMDIHNIQLITGHKSINALQRYIGQNPTKLKDALSSIFA